MKFAKVVLSLMIEEFLKLAKKFFQPLAKWPVSIFVWGVIITIVGLLYVSTGVGELARHNADDGLFLAADALVLGIEPMSAIGPDFVEEEKRTARGLRAYIERIEERHLAAMLRGLYPEAQPRERLLPLLAKLEEPREDQEEAREVIRRAGEQMNEFYKDSEELSATEVIWFKSERLPNELVRDLDEALEESDKWASQLEEDPTIENALAACSANRKTMLLAFLARMGYGSQEKNERFLTVVKKTRDGKEKLADRIEDPEAKKTVLSWRDSEQRRVEILKAMLDGDMERVRELLKEAIKIAYEQKEKAFHLDKSLRL